jgi:hypothetical protein
LKRLFLIFSLVAEARSYNYQQNEQNDDQYKSGTVIATAIAVTTITAAPAATEAHSFSPHLLLSHYQYM